MELKYKILISNHNLYKEIKLNFDRKELKIGTELGADVRFYKESFFEDFELTVVRYENDWVLSCSENLYFDSGDVRRLITKKLSHGDSFKVKYQKFNQTIFTLDFLIDFDSYHKNYDCAIDVLGQNQITIGNRDDNDIVMHSEYALGDNVILKRDNRGLVLKVLQTTYGIYKNGCLISEMEIINQGDFFSIADCSFYYNGETLYATNASQLEIRNFSWNLIKESQSTLTYPCFNRSTHVEYELSDEEIQICDPMEKPTEPEGSLWMSLLPSVAMLVLTIVVRGFMSNSSNVGYILFSICSMTIGIVTSIHTFLKNKNDYDAQVLGRENEYVQYINKKKEEIVQARLEEQKLLNQIYPNENETLLQVSEFSGELFNRSRESKYFLHIRVGSGEYPAMREIKYSVKERIVSKDELERIPSEIAKEFQMVKKVPVICDLTQFHNLGIVGEKMDCYDLLKIITLDLCAHHYSREVKVFYVFDKTKREQLKWIRLLPHVQNDISGMRNIVCDEESKIIQFEYLYKEFCRRRESKNHDKNVEIVVLLIDDMGILQHPVSKFLSEANKYHIHFISFASHMEQLPMYCEQIIKLFGNNAGELIEAESAKSTHFIYNSVSDREMWLFTNKLAPVYCKEIALESSLVSNITFFQMLGIFSANDLNIERRWKEKDICKTMAAPIGVKSKNEIIYLDLHEKAHGPHGLVAGTTGSGKSELLQTYILSMALQFSPYEVAFVLIDFKGGGMANQFRNLPHLVGAITDIDGNEINRSLLSIRAEQDKRKEKFALANVNNINEYMRKYRSGEVTEALPHLIIIVDEFAELKSKQPAFMDELISAARTGRSLGIHLILATQKPAGQVSDQIWSNSRFKLCLKVQNQADSNEVIKSPLAAEIIEPGRAYFQVGNNEIFELIQSAYCGAPERQVSESSNTKKFKISQIDLSGKQTIVFQQKQEYTQVERKTQLESVVDYIRTYCETKNIKLNSICQSPLPDLLKYPNNGLMEEKNINQIGVNIGIYDDPRNQRQGEAELMLSDRNTVIIGSSQYGKTNLIQNIIRSLATKYSPKEVNIYILDFGTMFLKNYEQLPHVGGVVCASEDEKLRNLFKLLNQEIITRKEHLMNMGVSSFSAYKEAGYRDMPFILLVVDNFTALKEMYFCEEDILLPLCREGVTLGISVLIANTVTGGFGYRYFSTISNYIAFYCNESDEINNVFGYCKERPAQIPGRCMMKFENGIHQTQTYLAFEGKREIDRSRNIASFIELQIQRYGNMKAISIPSIPEKLTLEQVYETMDSIQKNNNFSIGLDYENIEKVVLPFSNQFMIAILGEQVEKRNQFVSMLLRDVQENIFERDVEVYLIDSISKSYKGYEEMPYMKEYTTRPEKLIDIVEELNQILQERYQMIEEEGEEVLENCPLQLVVVNNRRALDLLSASRTSMKTFDYISQNLRQMKVLFIFTEIENVSMPSNDMMRRIRDEQKVIIMETLKNVKLYTNISIQMKNKNIVLGRSDAFYMNRESILRIKLAEEE